MHYYKLVNKKPVACSMKEAINNDNRLFRTTINGVLVSTIFLTTNHGSKQKPMLFETMVFDSDIERMMDRNGKRYQTYEEAKLGHQQFVEIVRAIMN